MYWALLFGHGDVVGQVIRLEREVQTMRLIERVQLRDLATAQFEQLTGFLDAECLGLTDHVYIGVQP